MELRNPFGIRDNEVVMIEDISVDERGLRCRCICPSCGEPFEAKMGEIKRHHFSHCGNKGCDETNAYLMGLYSLIKEYFGSSSFSLPPVIAGFDLSAYSPITEENAGERTYLRSRSVNDDKEIKVFDRADIKFSSSYIEKTREGRPKAVVAEVNGKKLAFVIKPPEFIKSAETKKYKDFPTVEIDFSDMGDIISESKKDELFRCISENKDIARWVHNPKISNAYPQIIKRSKAYYEKAQERIRKEKEEQKKREEAERLKREEAERIRKEEEERLRKEMETLGYDTEENSSFISYIEDSAPITIKASVNSVIINGVVYTAGTAVEHPSGKGVITSIIKIVKTGKHEIEILFNSGKKNRFELETLVKYNIIRKLW